MGKGYLVELATVDPSSPRFMLIDEDTKTTVKKALEAELAKERNINEDGGQKAHSSSLKAESTDKEGGGGGFVGMNAN